MIGRLIGAGNTAEVFLWKENEILKLFRKDFPIEAVEREYKISKIISEQNLPVPKVIEMMEHEGRKGIIYERVVGKSLLDQIMKNPFTFKKNVKKIASLQYLYHQCSGLELPGYKDYLEWNINHTDQLTDPQKSTLIKLLKDMPDGNSLCHGDFHPGNIMGSDNNYYILDWMTATIGSPSADVSRTIMLLKDAVLPDSMPTVVKAIINKMRNKMTRIYISEYMKLSNISFEEVNKWRIVILAARLQEWVPPSEKKAILGEITKWMKEHV